MQSGIRSGCDTCCSLQSVALQEPASHRGHTATLLLSWISLQRPVVCASHFPVLHLHNASLGREHQYNPAKGFRIEQASTSPCGVTC